MDRMLTTRVQLSEDRKSLEFWVDENTYSRSCGESRSAWNRIARVCLKDLPGVLDDLVSGKDGMVVYLHR